MHPTDLADEAARLSNNALELAEHAKTLALGVSVLGYNNWPGRIPVASSSLYARNLLTFLTTFWDKDAKAPKLPDTDDIIKGVMLTRGGAIVHPNFLPSQAA